MAKKMYYVEGHDYLVADYTIVNRSKGDVPVLHRVQLKELWEVLDAAWRSDAARIAVYEIGDCVLDWG